MVFLIIEFLSIFFLVLGMLLLLAVLLRHFRGMNAPAHWVYFLGAFSLMAISSAYTKIFNGDAGTVDGLIRLVANLSIFLGSYEVFIRYESSVAKKLKEKRANK